MAVVSERIGQAVTGVYNKVMNFRAIDPTDSRDGLSASGAVDRSVWHEFFDSTVDQLDMESLDTKFEDLWGGVLRPPPVYKDFGDAPNDDLDDLKMFAARVRKGQPAFRKNLLAAYGERCVVTGFGPKQVLEAVHILSHADSGINELDNGLLMRADLHHLLDANLLRISPETLEIVVDLKLKNTEYWNLNGNTLRSREDGTNLDSRYLKMRWIPSPQPPPPGT